MASQHRIIRLPEMLTLVGLSRATIYRKMKKGTFPERFKIGDQAIGWRLPDTLTWLANPR